MNRLFCCWVVRIFSAFVLMSVLPLHSQAQGWSFSEEFNGNFDQNWVSSAGSLPNESLAPLLNNNVVYRGGVSFTFSDIGEASGITLNEQNAAGWSRYGYVSTGTVSGTYGILEARINTLTQGGANIDGLFDLWLLNKTNHSKYVRVGLFGNISDTQRSWCYSSGLEQFALPALAYQSNTWYRVRISQLPTKNLEVSVWDDAGTTKLVSHTFGHTLDALGTEFQVGFSQWMGGTNFTNGMLVAVDYIRAVATISGRITLQGAINQAQPLTFEFRPVAGGNSFTRSLTLNLDRTYQFNDIPPGKYVVRIKGTKWLAKVLTVDATNGSVTGVNTTLLAADANNDNSVDVLDLDLLIQAFDAESNSPNWIEGADFNCDDIVDVLDLDLLIANFDRVGDD